MVAGTVYPEEGRVYHVREGVPAPMGVTTVLRTGMGLPDPV